MLKWLRKILDIKTPKYYPFRMQDGFTKSNGFYDGDRFFVVYAGSDFFLPHVICYSMGKLGVSSSPYHSLGDSRLLEYLSELEIKAIKLWVESARDIPLHTYLNRVLDSE